jgi:arylsulfatase A-like enzyme
LFSQGESFVGLMRGEGSGKEYVYGFGSKNNLSIRSKTWKLMSDDGLNRNRYRLYNVKNDPDEQHNVVSEYPEIQGDLEKKLRLRVEESLELRARMVNSGRGAGVASGREVKLKEDEKERLRSLGYVL